MATQVKPTKKNSPAIHHGANRDNAPADVYAPPHTMSGKKIGAKEMKESTGHYMTDPNTMKADESTPGGMPARRVSVGNITRGPKEDGITIRGYGAATKGIKARGPMA